MNVALIRWPHDTDRLAALRERQRPRLLLLEGKVNAPVSVDPFEDWIRLPADQGDVKARIDTLAQRWGRRRHHKPTLDEDGVLRVGAIWVALPPVEARLTEALLNSFGSVTSRTDLTHAGWPTGRTDRNALDVHMLRLRRRIESLPLSIRTVRSRGYVLDSNTMEGK